MSIFKEAKVFQSEAEHKPVVSVYHEQKINKAVGHCKERGSATPLVLSSYTHPQVDQQGRIVTGDVVWRKLTNRLPGAEVKPLVWESQPVGIAGIRIPQPESGGVFSSAEVVGTSLPPLPPGAKVDIRTKSQLEIIRYVLPGEEKKLTGLVVKNMGNSAFWKDKVAENVAALNNIYQSHISKATGASLAQLLDGIAHEITANIFGEDATLEHQPSSMQGLNQQMVEILEKKAREVPLRDMLSKLYPAGSSKVAVGWLDGHPASISFSKSGKLGLVNYYQGLGGKGTNIGEIDEAKFFEMLKKQEFSLLDPFWLGLGFLNEAVAVVHMGNDYGLKEKVVSAGSLTEGGYYQVFDDKKDSWPPVVMPGEIKPTLAGMFVWNPGGKVLREKLKESLEIGEPVLYDPAKFG